MSAKEKLRKLAAEAPARNKTAYVRGLLPEIEAALARGVKAETVVAELCADSGLDFTVNRLYAILSRLRRRPVSETIARVSRAMVALPEHPAAAPQYKRDASKEEGRSVFQHDPHADVKDLL